MNESTSKRAKRQLRGEVQRLHPLLPVYQRDCLLSRREVAARLGVCVHTIARATRAGLLPAVKFNARLVRYRPEAVEAFIGAAAVGGRTIA